MRRVTYALGALCAVGTLTLAVPGTASASDGLLTIDQASYADPSGCYATSQRPVYISNNTDQMVLVFSGPNCTGALTQVVSPGQEAAAPIGFSVYVN